MQQEHHILQIVVALVLLVVVVVVFFNVVLDSDNKAYRLVNNALRELNRVNGD